MGKRQDGSSHRTNRGFQEELQRLLVQTVAGNDPTMDTLQVAAILAVSYSAPRKYINGTRKIPLEKTLLVAQFAASRNDRRLIDHIRRAYFTCGTGMSGFDS